MTQTYALSEESDSYQLKIEHRKDYLYAYVGEGKDSLKTSKEYWLRVLMECNRHNFKKVLIEEDLEGNMTFPELYDFSIWLANLKFHGILITFVDRHLDHYEANQLSELIVTNRGLRGKVFNNFDEAEKWLLSN
ncbi:MAG: hypothetical protein R2747_23770 [Pyrinomonadaceae bacterium]